jgi:neutral ceramidase
MIPRILFLAFLTIVCAEAANMRIGTASVDITPQPGTPMAGYYYERAAEAAHDPLFAKALVLEHDGTRVALVQLDLISTSRWFVEQARAEIERSTGIPGQNVLISASHAHTGPILSRTSSRYDSQGGTNTLAAAYAAQLPRQIAQAVRQASGQLTPVKITAGVGLEEGLGFNRRFFMRDGSVGWNPGKLNPNIVRPAGPTDPEVSVVYFETTNNLPRASYVNFAIHLDNIGGRQFSSDAPGVVARLLAEARGSEFFTLYHTGACGNINHINVALRRQQSGFAEAARIGTILAANVLKTLDSGLRPVTNLGPLRVRSAMVTLPLPTIEPGEVDKARETILKLGGQSSSNRPAFLEQVQAFKAVEVAEREGRPQEVEVQVIAFGEQLAWVSLPGEIFVELGLAVKRGSPFQQTMIAELANGSIGYIPNREAYPQGNYEVISARCAQGSGEMLVDAALRLLRDLYREQRSAPGLKH